MFKFGTIGAFNHVRNNPRNKAKTDLQNGMGVVLNDTTEEAKVPANATEAQGIVWFVGNIIDKPEVRSFKDFIVEAGEFVRGFLVEDANELTVELDYRVLADDYSTLAVGNHLVVANETNHVGKGGKWVKPDGVTVVDSSAYSVHLEILKKTSFGDKGILAKVVKK